MKKNVVDLFVVGGGSGGVRAARRAAEQGRRVVLAEDGRLGGTCVNVGCVPKKLLSYAATFGHHLEDAAGYGWQVPAGHPRLDWAKLRDAKAAEIKRLNGVYAAGLAKSGVEVVNTRARLAGPNKVIAGDREYEAADILVATGSRPAVPPVPGYAEHACVSDDIFTLPSLPARVAVAGAGYIAVEFACILAGLGVDTTLVHRGPTVLRNFDSSIQRHLLTEMERNKVRLRLDAKVTGLERTADGLVASIADAEPVVADLYLCATGRSPNSAGLGLEEAGVTVGKRGEIPVNDNYTTNVPSVHAVGDVIGRVALTPVAIAEAMRFVASRYGGYGPPVDYDLIPTAVFTHPNVGTVGLTEEQARAQVPDCQVTEAEFRPMVHSLTGRGERTLMKLVFAPDNGRVLGAHMVGPDAGELMQGIAIALAKGATKYDFDAMVGIHPTAAEEFVSMR